MQEYRYWEKLMTVQILRNTRLWVSTAIKDQVVTKDNTWEVLIQDDFAFNQDSNFTDINLNEAGPKPTRGSKRYNDSLNPADWNFSTYLRPYMDDAGTGSDDKDDYVLTPDYALWHSLASGSPMDIKGNKGVTANKVNMLVKFTDNQYHELNKVTLFYLVDNVWYRIHDVQINTAEVSVDIDGIGMTNWTGQGTKVEPLTTQPFDPASADFSFPEKIFEDASYIKNKLSVIKIWDNNDSDKYYDIPVTGSTITITNNITYLTPSTLSRLDLPIGSFTGTFEVTASLQAYLRNKSVGNLNDRAAELLAKMLKSRAITNSFKVALCLGGEYDTPAPGVVFVIPTAHLSVPTIETADVLGTTIELKGIPTALDAGDEVYVGMSPVYTKTIITNLINTGDGA